MALNNQTENEAEAYWKKLLSGYTTPSTLNIKKITKLSSLEQTYNEEIFLTQELQSKIRNFSQEQHILVETVFLGAWAYLLSLYSGYDDVVFGYQLINEQSSLTDAIPVRVQFQEKETVNNYLQGLEEQLKKSQLYSGYTKIKKCSSLSADLPLFDHYFCFLNSNSDDQSNKVSSHDLIVTVVNYGECIKIKFDAKKYNDLSIKNLLTQYEQLLKNIINERDNLLTDLSLLTDVDKQKIMLDWNQTETDFPNEITLHQLFEEQVERTPDNIALILEDRSVTYSDMNKKANQVALYLRKLGIKVDDKVAICMERSFELIITIMGILKAGGAYVPLDPAYPRERLAFMLDDSNAMSLMIQSKFEDIFSFYQKNIIDIDNDDIFSGDIENPSNNAKPDNLAYVIYTSGSTGKPKGVLIEHRSAVNTLYGLQKRYPLTEKDAYLFKTNHTFDVSVSEIFGWLFQGGRLVILKHGDEKLTSTILDVIEKNKITHINFVPSVLQTTLDSASEADCKKLRNIKYFFVGGEAISKALIQRVNTILAEGAYFENLYGPTETTVWATSFNLRSDYNTVNTPIGKPLQNVKTYILDKTLNICPIGIPGELHIGGSSLARGYLNRQELNSEKFIKNIFSDTPGEHIYKTGDLCRYMPDGNIEYMGRIDNQVKIRGFRIELGEIDACVSLHPDIQKAVVTAREYQAGERILVCYYILKEGRLAPSVDQFRRYLLSHLPDYMVPSAFVRLASFPLTSSGKLDRKALPAPDFTIKQDYVAPRSDLENIIATIWSQELNVEKISVTANFFELGGHSLSAARIISKIEKQTHKKMSLSDLYNTKTIAELVNIIKNARASSSDTLDKPLVKNKQTGSIPLSANQFGFWLLQRIKPTSSALRIVSCKHIYGKVDPAALTHAFETILKNHEILSYYISQRLPLQSYQGKCKFHLIEQNLSHLSESRKEEALLASFHDLEKYNGWKKNSPLFVAKIFYLNDQEAELQICVPHIIFDEISVQVFFSELSKYYLNYINKSDNHTDITQYREYIFYERDQIDKLIDRDIVFWTDYLRDTTLLTAPMTGIIHDIDMQNTRNTTFIECPNDLITDLRNFCISNKISITDALYAATVLGAKQNLFQGQAEEKLAAIIVRSGRDKEQYDNTMGNLFRLDLIKVYASPNTSLVDVSKNIQKSLIEAEPYQFCSSDIKLACLLERYWKNKTVFNTILNIFSGIFSALFSKLSIFQKRFSVHFRRYIYMPKDQYVLIINILNNFILDKDNQDENFLGLRSIDARNNDDHGTEIENYLVVTFAIRIEDNNKRYLIIAGNLKPEIREKIGKDIISFLIIK